MTEDTPIDPRDLTPEDLTRLGFRRVPQSAAIRRFCLECMGGSRGEVLLCASAGCPLWLYRMGTNPWREKREMPEEQRLAAVERLRLARERASDQRGPASGVSHTFDHDEC